MKKRIIKADDERLFIVAEAIRQGVTKEEINEWCEMDFFFLQKVENIVNMEREVKANVGNMEVLQTAKRNGLQRSLHCSSLEQNGARNLRYA